MLHMPVQTVEQWPGHIIAEWQAFIKIKNSETEAASKKN